MLSRFHDHRLPAPGESWDDFTMANARSFRRALLSVRNGARLNAGTRPTTREFADAEAQLQVYVAADFTAEQAFNIAIGVTRYVLGFVLEEQDERDRADDGESEWGDGDPMDEVAPFPLLSAALKPLIGDGGGTINTEAVFEGGLGYMIAGMRASLPPAGTKKQRRPKTPPNGSRKKTAPA